MHVFAAMIYLSVKTFRQIEKSTYKCFVKCFYAEFNSRMLCVLFIEEVINCGRHVNTGMLGAAFDVVGSG